MQSTLNLSEFKNKLRDSVKEGNPKLKIFNLINLFYYDSEKLFYGYYTDTMFSITSNLKVLQSFYVIKGSYKVKNGALEIQYSILPKFKYLHYFWVFWILCGVGMLIFINVKARGIGSDLAVIDSFLILMLCFGSFAFFRAKGRLERKFLKAFRLA